MEVFLIKAAQLLAALALLVIIHEFGHYIIARAFGIKVEKFYLFFNPWFSLFKWRPKKKEPKYDKNGNEKASWRDTEYGIGWLPFGGYVKIAGMIDESMDKEQMAQPEKPWEFRAKPAYQRLCVMIAGVCFNFLLAIIIYAGIAFHWGNKYVPLEEAYEGMKFSDVAKQNGFRDGDIILEADGNKVNAAEHDFLLKIVEAKNVRVLRKSKSDSLAASGLISAPRDTVEIELPENFLLKLEGDDRFIDYRLPVYVKQIQGGSAASKAGLAEGDRVIAVGGVPTPSYDELEDQLGKHKGEPVDILVERDGKAVTLNATPDSNGKLGFGLKMLTEVYPTVTEHYTFLRSIPKGWELGTNQLGNYVGSLKYLFTSDGAKNIGGFGAIGGMFPKRWNWLSFWEITAFLSVILAFMNIIPIPGLDGGHVIFLLWEVVTRRKVSEKVLEYAQYAGMFFILMLLLYANGMDIVRAIIK